MIDGMDEWMGRIIEAVADRGELDNTFIVYSADHGEMLGDQGRWNKGVPLEPSVHVPLVVSGPGVARNRRTDALVELIDLAATFVDIAGLDTPEQWDARPLTEVLRGRSDAHRDLTVSALGNWRMVFDGGFKYVERQGEPFALYDLTEDPFELSSVLPSETETARHMREKLSNADSPNEATCSQVSR
jgi:choline-sulfatase